MPKRLMPKRLETIVVLLGDRVICASFSGGLRAGIRKLVTYERKDLDDPAAALATALASFGERLGQVAVLSTDVGLHVVELPTSTVAGLQRDALEQALAFELESFAGFNVGDAALTARPLAGMPGRNRYWVSVASYAFRDQLENAITAFGGRLSAVAHPAGVPQSLGLDVERARDWRRVEFWRDLTLRISANGKLLSVQSEEPISVPTARAASIQQWRSSCPQAVGDEQFRESGESGLPTADLVADVVLSNEAALRHWLALWYRALSARTPRAPIQRLLRAPMSSQTRSLLALGLAALAFGACYMHHGKVLQQLELTKQLQAQAEAPGKELEAVKTQSTEITKTLTKDRTTQDTLRADIDSIAFVFGAQKERFVNLLYRLGEGTNRAWTLRRIVSSGQDLTLYGMTLHPEHIGELAANLASDVRPLGWDVEPPSQAAGFTDTEGRPWYFRLILRDASITREPASAAPKIEFRPLPKRSPSDNPKTELLVRTPPEIEIQ